MTFTSTGIPFAGLKRANVVCPESFALLIALVSIGSIITSDDVGICIVNMKMTCIKIETAEKSTEAAFVTAAVSTAGSYLSLLWRIPQ